MVRMALAAVVALLPLADAHAAPKRRGDVARCIQQVLKSEGGRVATVVADPTLSVRTEPSRDSTIIGHVPDRAPIVVLGRQGGEWLRVIAVSAEPGCVMKLGYVVQDYVR